MIISEVTSEYTKLSDIPAGSYFLCNEHLFLKDPSLSLSCVTYKFGPISVDAYHLHPDSLVKQVEIGNIEYKLI